MCDFITGYISGIIGVIVGHPFDTIKVNQQVIRPTTTAITAIASNSPHHSTIANPHHSTIIASSNSPHHSTILFNNLINNPPKSNNNTLIKTTYEIYTRFGLNGYFKGLTFPLLTSGVINSIFFGVYHNVNSSLIELDGKNKEVSKKRREQPKQKPTYYKYNFIAGCLGGLVPSIIICPIDVIKIKLQTAKKSDIIGPIQLSRNILRNYGIKGFYQGFWSTVLRDVPSYGLYMVTYEMCSEWIKTYYNRKKNAGDYLNIEFKQNIGLFISGGFAGTLAWWSILPIDIIKSRIQAIEYNQNNQNSSILNHTKCIYSEYGLRGFFTGFWIMGLRAFPVNGAIFITLEWLNYYICNKR